MTLYEMLSHLWLHEPDAITLARAREVPALAAALRADDDPSTLAVAYADLFLLNVYPYGTAYTDEWAELNTPEAQRVAELYEAYGYQPRELNEVGAPDHLGLCLGFVAQLATPTPALSPCVSPLYGDTSRRASRSQPPPRPSPATRRSSRGRAGVGDFLTDLRTWAPVCCLAAERDPSAHPFYRALAQLTRETLLSGELRIASGETEIANFYPEPAEGRNSPFAIRNSQFAIRLRDIVRFLLTPARSGMFLSRARLGQLAKELGMRLPFGSRFEVAEWLFACAARAGEGQQLSTLLQKLPVEANEWAAAYRGWALRYPAWQPAAARWLERIAQTRDMLREMEQLAQSGIEVEYASSADDDSG